MTTARRQRCEHCNTSYIFHPSFYGGDEINYPYNNDRYCPDCFKVVKQALSEIPLKYEKRFIPSDQYSKEQIVEHQEKRCSSSEGLPFRRIFPGLFSNDGNKHHIVSEYMPDGNWYKVEWWSNTPDIVEVTKESWVKVDS